MRSVWHFHGGLKLEGHKADSLARPLQPCPLPPQLILPVQQHIGEAAHPIVEVGDYVLKGQLIAEAEGYVSAPVHASSSGTVVAIEPRPIPHPSGMSADCIVIDTDGEDEWIETPHHENDYQQLDPSALRNFIREAVDSRWGLRDGRLSCHPVSPRRGCRHRLRRTRRRPRGRA